MTDINEDSDEIRKVDGRTREGRAARAAAVETRSPTRQTPTRQTLVREPSRSPSRNAVVRGRDGEVLTRKRTGTVDVFAIVHPDPDWELQWIAHAVTGNTEIVQDQNLAMLENGWRPVMADRFPGRFMPAGYKGHIIRGSQGLYERPKVLSDEARAEDLRAAHQLVADRNESLKLSGTKSALPEGFEMDKRYRGTGGDVRMSIDRALDIPQPQHQIAREND